MSFASGGRSSSLAMLHRSKSIWFQQNTPFEVTFTWVLFKFLDDGCRLWNLGKVFHITVDPFRWWSPIFGNDSTMFQVIGYSKSHQKPIDLNKKRIYTVSVENPSNGGAFVLEPDPFLGFLENYSHLAARNRGIPRISSASSRSRVAWMALWVERTFWWYSGHVLKSRKPPEIVEIAVLFLFSWEAF